MVRMSREESRPRRAAAAAAFRSCRSAWDSGIVECLTSALRRTSHTSVPCRLVRLHCAVHMTDKLEASNETTDEALLDQPAHAVLSMYSCMETAAGFS